MLYFSLTAEDKGEVSRPQSTFSAVETEGVTTLAIYPAIYSGLGTDEFKLKTYMTAQYKKRSKQRSPF